MTTAVQPQREPQLLDQTVVLIGGSAGIGLATARLARAEGAQVIVTGRDPGRLQRAADELEARSSAAFDAADPTALEQFLDGLPQPVDHILVTAGRPYYGPLADIDVAQAQRSFDEHLWLALRIARAAPATVRPGGTLFLYGPYKRDGVHTAPSNEAFDASLKSRDPSWGIRDMAEVAAEAAKHGFALDEIVPMPANNFSLIFRR